jgi:chromosome segregation ATPase
MNSLRWSAHFSPKGDASNAARRAKAELEVKCRELEDQVDQYKSDLENAKNEVENLGKSKDRLRAEKDQLEGKVQDAEGRCRALEENLKQKESELRMYNKTAGDDAQGEVRTIKQKADEMSHDLEQMGKQIKELQDVNTILTKQHEDDQVLLEDVKATNMMLREALETKELEWGTSDSNLASFAPKESLLGEIEQHFNRFQTFGSPQRGSSKMPNFMDVVKRDFENLALRIHRLRQKMEKKWPEPPAGTPAAGGSPAFAPNAAPAAEPASADA